MTDQTGAQTPARSFAVRIYYDAMTLAEEARAYLVDIGAAANFSSGPRARTQRSTCVIEAMNLSNRLMHLIAWSLLHRAVDAGEVTEDAALAPDNLLRRQTVVSETEPEVLAELPSGLRRLAEESEKLFSRALRLEDGLLKSGRETDNPVHRLLGQLDGFQPG